MNKVIAAALLFIGISSCSSVLAHGNDAYTVLLIQSENPDGSTMIEDTSLGSSVPHFVNVYGNAHHETDQHKFGSSSIYLDGNASFLTIAACNDFDLGTGPFTIDFWVYTTNIINDYNEMMMVINTSAGDPGAGVFTIQRDLPSGELRMFWVDGAVSFNYFATQNNIWRHLAVVREGPYLYLFVDGVLTNRVNIGCKAVPYGFLEIGGQAHSVYPRYFGGYLEEIRVSKGIARWKANFTPPTAPNAPDITPTPWPSGNDANTVLLIHSDTSDGSTVFQDSSLGATELHTLTPHGNVHHESDQAKFGATSIHCDGAGDYLQAPDSADWDFGYGNFTIDFWLNSAGAGDYMISRWNGGYIDWGFDQDANTIRFMGSDGNDNGYGIYLQATKPVFDGAWHHIAAVRSGSVAYLFIDGIANAVDASAAIDITHNSVLQIGADGQGGREYNGYFDEIRVTKGVARWTTNFIPPSGPYALAFTATPTTTVSPTSTPTPTPAAGNDEYCVLLIHSNGPDGSTVFVDSSAGASEAHPITPHGDVHHDAGEPHLGSSSIGFDGNADYLSIPNSVDWDFCSGDFTIDFWANHPVSGTNIDPYYFTFGANQIGMVFYPNDHSDPSRRGRIRTLGDFGFDFQSPLNTIQEGWHHIALVGQSNGAIKLYYDGQNVGSGTRTSSIDISSTLYFGVYDGGTIQAWWYEGFMDEIRISRGIARWTSDFTPPPSPYYTPQPSTPTAVLSPTATPTLTPAGTITTGPTFTTTNTPAPPPIPAITPIGSILVTILFGLFFSLSLAVRRRSK